jgi:hypothetical protein
LFVKKFGIKVGYYAFRNTSVIENNLLFSITMRNFCPGEDFAIYNSDIKKKLLIDGGFHPQIVVRVYIDKFRKKLICSE